MSTKEADGDLTSVGTDGSPVAVRADAFSCGHVQVTHWTKVLGERASIFDTFTSQSLRCHRHPPILADCGEERACSTLVCRDQRLPDAGGRT